MATDLLRMVTPQGQYALEVTPVLSLRGDSCGFPKAFLMCLSGVVRSVR